MTSCATPRKQWVSPAVAAIAVLLFLATSLFSVTHQGEYDVHTFGQTEVLAAIEKGDPGDAAQIEGVGMIVCPSGPLCHATVAFLLNTEEPFMLPHPMELMRPDSGALFEGQIPDVVTPPPLSMRA